MRKTEWASRRRKTPGLCKPLRDGQPRILLCSFVRQGENAQVRWRRMRFLCVRSDAWTSSHEQGPPGEQHPCEARR